MAKNGIIGFIQEVRDEVGKVTWPTRRELVVSTIMVMIMVVLASVFFMGVDTLLKWGVERVLFGI